MIQTQTIDLQNFENNWSEIRIKPEDFDMIPLEGFETESDNLVRIENDLHPYNGQGVKNISNELQRIEIPIDTMDINGKWFKLELYNEGEVAIFIQVSNNGWVANKEIEIERIDSFGNSTIGITLAPNSILWSARAKAVDVGTPTLIYENTQSAEYFKIDSYLESEDRDVLGGRGHYLVEISKRNDFRDPNLISLNTQNNISFFYEEQYELNEQGEPDIPIPGTKNLLTKEYAGYDSFTPVGANIGDAGWVATLGINNINTFENFFFRVYVIDGNWE